MKKIAALMTFVIAASAAPAWAEVMIEDADGNGTFNYAEMAVAYPTLTEDMFAQVDGDGDGEVTAEELQAAMDAEILVK